jgi:hypothetical protein
MIHLAMMPSHGTTASVTAHANAIDATNISKDPARVFVISQVSVKASA